MVLSIGYDNTNTTYSGKMTGNGSLTKVGSGALALTGNNAYTGSTAVNGGILVASTTASVPNLLTAFPRVTVASGATLAVSVGGAGQWTSANIDTLLSSSGVFTSGAKLGFDTSGGSSAYNSNITRTGSGIVKLGTNTLVLSGSSAAAAALRSTSACTVG